MATVEMKMTSGLWIPRTEAASCLAEYACCENVYNRKKGAYREFLDATDFALVGGDINGDVSFRRHLRLAEAPPPSKCRCSDCFMFTKLMFKLEILTRIKPNNNLRPISSYQGRLFLNATSGTHIYFDKETNVRRDTGLQSVAPLLKGYATVENLTISELNEFVIAALSQDIDFMCSGKVLI
uniref:Uncharacterized protein n=1 Tax=Brassica oleracea var. oleracea TaxID=109376 RepID=A0A0D3DN86_BRAOL